MEQILQHIYHPEVSLSKVDTLQYFITKWVQYILLMLHFDRRFVGNFIPLLLWSPETIQFWYYKFGYFKFYITQAAYFKVELDLHFHKFYIFSCCHSFGTFIFDTNIHLSSFIHPFEHPLLFLILLFLLFFQCKLAGLVLRALKEWLSDFSVCFIVS